MARDCPTQLRAPSAKGKYRLARLPLPAPAKVTVYLISCGGTTWQAYIWYLVHCMLYLRLCYQDLGGQMLLQASI